MSDLKIQGVVEVTTEGAESAMNRVGEAAGKMSSKVQAGAEKAGRAVDGIGDGAGGSADKFTRAESRMSDSIKRATTHLEQLGKTAAQKLEFKIFDKGLDAAKFQPALDKLRELEAAQTRVVGSSGRFGQGLQNTSYQLQDFIVQVNGGTDASKALGQQLPQMLIGFGAMGAAVGVVAALLPNLISAFSDAGAGAKNFAGAMADFDKAIGDVGSTTKSFDMENLYEEFNNSSDAVRAATLEQLNFQREFIRTTQLVSEKKFGESLSGFGEFSTLDKLAGSFGGTGAEKLSKQLGVSLAVAKDLLPALNGLKSGATDVSLAFEQFGTKLLGGNQKATELAASMATLAKSEREAAAASSSISEAQAKMAKGHVLTKKEADEAAKSTKGFAKEADALSSILNKIAGKDTGLDASYWKDLDTLFSAYKRGKLSTDAYAEAVAKLTISQKFNQDANKAADDAAKAALKSEEEYTKALYAADDALVKKAESLESEVEFYGLAESAIQATIISRLEEARAMAAASGAYPEHLAFLDREIEARQRIATASSQKEFLDTNRKASEQATKDWEKFGDDINRALTDALMRGFEDGKSFGQNFVDSLKNSLKTAALKVVVNYVTNGAGQLVGTLGNAALNGVFGTSGSNGGAGTNYIGTASNLSSAYNMATGSSMSTIGSGISYIGNAAGSLGTSAYGAGMGLSSAQAASASAAYSAAAAEASASAASSLALSADAAAAGNLAAADALAAQAAASEAAAASYTTAGSSISSGSSAATAVGWIAAIVMGMYMSGEAWQNGIRWENYAKDDDAKKYDAEVGIRALHDEPARALFGDKFVDSKFYAVAGGGSLSAMIHGAVQKGLWGGDWGPDGSDSRLSGTFSEANRFTGGQISQDFVKDGGWFHSDKRETRRQDISPELDAVLDGMYRTIRNSLVMTGELFDDFTLADKITDFSLKIDNLSGSKLDSSIVAASDQLAEAMGKVLFPSIDALRVNVVEQAKGLQSQLEQAKRTGNVALASNLDAQIKNLEGLDNESWFSAFGRALQDAQGVTRVLDLMGKEMTNVFGEGNANRVLILSAALAEMFGGVSKLSESFGAYYGHFYTAEEQTQQAWADMGKAFEGLNQTMPTTREGFRALVDGLDLATVGGQSTFKALMDLQGGFAQLVPAIEVVSDAAIAAALTTLRADLSAKFAPQRTVAQAESAILAVTPIGDDLMSMSREAISTAMLDIISGADEATLNLIGSLSGDFDLVFGALDGIAETAAKAAADILATTRGLTDEGVLLGIELLRAQGRPADASAAQRTLDTQGYTAAQVALYDYNQALRTQITTLNDAAAAAVAAQQAAVAAAAQIRGERDGLTRQLYAAQGNTTKLREMELAALDPSNRALQEQIWALEDSAKAATNAANAAQQLKSAWASLTDNIFDEVKRIRGLIGGDSPASYAQAQSQFAITSAQASAGSMDAAKALPGLSQSLLTLAETNAGTLLELQRIRAATATSLLTTGTAISKKRGIAVPSFDVGTNYVPNDMLARIHEGEAIIPKAFNPSANGNKELIEEIRRLNDRLARIEASAEKTRSSSELTARVLDDAARGKNPLTTEVAV